MPISAKRIHDRNCLCAKCLQEFAAQESAPSGDGDCELCDGAGYLLIGDQPEQLCYKCGGSGRATAGNAAPTEAAELQTKLDAAFIRKVLIRHLGWLGATGWDDDIAAISADLLASNTATAAPGDLDQAAAYRLWRDCELAEDCWFMEHIAEYLPNTQRAPTAAEWDAAMLRVMQDRDSAPSNPPAGAKEKE